MARLVAVPDRSELVPELSVEDLGSLSDDEVTDALLMWAGRVAAGEARLLAFLGEFDARGSWAGFPSCVSWLSWRLAIGPKTASEKVRVARSLRVLPLTRASFERGELSYTQVRAFTRFASPGNEAELVPVVRSCSGEQIERLARGIGRVKALERARDGSPQDGGAQDGGARYGVSVRYEDDGTAVLTARLPAEEAAIVLAALDTCQEQLELAAARTPSAEGAAAAESSAEDAPAAGVGSPPDWPAESSAEDAPVCPVSPVSPSPVPSVTPVKAGVSRQQALLQIVQDWLDSRSKSVRRRAKPRLTAQLDPLSGWARLHNGELLPPEIAATLSLTQFDRGRSQREVDLRLRQFLGAVDGERCRFPGCRHTRHLKAHHVIWWMRGGPTDLANLVLLCGRHHQLVHDEAFTMNLHPDRTLTVRTAEGTLLAAHPQLPQVCAEALDPAGNITGETCPNPWALDRLHLAYAVGVLIHLAA
jgi:hypothetical protein